MKRKSFERREPNGDEVRPLAASFDGSVQIRKSSSSKKRGRKLGGGCGGGRGGGLSLEAFATAKSKQQWKFPAETRERREFYSNAKIVQKYKKLRKQLDSQGQPLSPEDNVRPADGHVTAQGEGTPSDGLRSEKGKAGNCKERKPWVLRKEGERFKNHRRKPSIKGLSQIERIRDEVEEKNRERDQQREEKEQERAKQQEVKEKARRERKEVQAKYRKKTSRGQPVMKHQMERLLDAIQRQS